MNVDIAVQGRMSNKSVQHMASHWQCWLARGMAPCSCPKGWQPEAVLGLSPFKTRIEEVARFDTKTQPRQFSCYLFHAMYSVHEVEVVVFSALWPCERDRGG